MSKGGGAGKVYFVLYLAVVLELLIIIVERDEAEEHLHKKQKETMKIVESILTQLQAGSGTDGINTRPQDEITMVAPGVNAKDVIGIEVKTDRQYLVEVGVTDINEELTRREGENEMEYAKRVKKLVELGNVEELEYQVFYSNSADILNAPPFPTDKELKKMNIDVAAMQPGQTIAAPDGNVWVFKGVQRLTLDKEKIFGKIDFNNVTLESTTPIYQKTLQVGPSYNPTVRNLTADSAFYYSVEKTDITKGLKKRTFMVNFEPERQAGWFKLRFASRTNRILGVRKDQKLDELSSDAKVNIGTVQLTVGDLQKVKKELTSSLEKYNLPSETVLTVENDIDKFNDLLEDAKKAAFKEENAAEIASKVQLYGYIVKLLAPGQSVHFDQNQGSIEFNIHVQTPEPPTSNPALVLPIVRCFDKLAPVFQFTITPYQGEGSNKVYGEVKDINGATVASVICSPLTQTAAGTPIPPPQRGDDRQYIGTISKSLSPGKYTLVINHEINSKKSMKESELTIFETKLTEENETYIKRRFERAYYGMAHLVNQTIVPSSGGAIKPEEFRVYLRTDDQNQIAPIEGLTVTENRAPFLSSQSNKVFLRVTWKQPYTGKEVDLLTPELEADIKLRPPSINLAGKIEERSQNGNKVKMLIRNITTSIPELGEGIKSKVTLKAERPSLEGIDNNSVSIDMANPRESSPGSGIWEIELEADFKFPADKSKLSGMVTIPLTAIADARGKTNTDKKSLVFELKGEKQGRDSRGGGGRTPAPSGGSRTPAPSKPQGGSRPR